MRGILIKAAEKKVVAVDVKPAPNRSLEGLRALIGCEWVQPVVVGNGVTIWVDEERRLKQPTARFLPNGARAFSRATASCSAEMPTVRSRAASLRRLGRWA